MVLIEDARESWRRDAGMEIRVEVIRCVGGRQSVGWCGNRFLNSELMIFGKT